MIHFVRILLFFLLSIPSNLLCKDANLSGQILDESTTIPIPFSTVSVKGKGIGVATSIEGKFYLEIQHYNVSDSLEFRALGYKSYTIAIIDFLKRARTELLVTINLEAISFDLNPVLVFPSKKEETLGTLNNSTIGAAYFFTPGAQVAVFIPNDERKQGNIKSVSYFFTGKKFKPKAPFRVRIIAADREGKPGRELLLNSLIVNAPESDEWFTVNLEEYNLPVPEYGYFAGLELICTKKKFQYKTGATTNVGPKKVVRQGPSLGNTKTRNPHTWIGMLGRGWSKFDYMNAEGYSYNYMIKSTVIFKE